jgi:hypothetical protein
MEPISDKDLDKLFKQRFENFEAEPSANLWSKISDELNEPVKKKTSNSVYWMAAASVLVLVSATLYLYKPVEVIKLRGKTESPELVTVKPNPVKQIKVEESIPETINPVNPVRKLELKQTVYKAAVNKPTSGTEGREDLNRPKPDDILVAKDQAKIQNSNVVNSNPFASERILAAVEIPNTAIEESETDIPRRKVKGIGGLVNFVIAQVDKREDKLIEFKESSEGSEISGINLGLLKFKSRNK